MALWLVRAGNNGEYENKFLEEKRVYVTWDGFSPDLKDVESRKDLEDLLTATYQGSKAGTINHWARQIWAFTKKFQIGDWIVLPSKKKSAVHIGEIVSGYKYDAKAVDPYFHFRNIKWIETDIPRTKFDQDILYSFGAFMTICEIKRNDAEVRVRAMAENGWNSALPKSVAVDSDVVSDESEVDTDVELLARDQIAKLVISKFKGHHLTDLIDSILRAKGFQTYVSPPGPDKGVDILAGKGDLGFDEPRLCVQVKSQETPVDRPTLDQLIGTMQNFNSTKGLLVSWGGFKSSVEKEISSQFFRVRLWGQKEIIDQLFRHYEELDEDIRADIPIKKIWTVSPND